MKSSSVIIILLIAFAVSMYFLGKKNGTTELKATIINNALLVKQIAELSSLEVSGTTTTKLTNVGENAGVWESMKNYFAENTLQVSIPYIAKFGVDVSKGNISVNKNDSSFIINLPPCKMLSFQLQLDRLETMNQTGLFAHTTVADMRLAQQQLYAAANQQLSTNAGYIEKAKAHIAEIYAQYYQPLGYKVVCTFTQP